MALIKVPPKTTGLTDDEIRRCLKTLTPREETVLNLRWGLDKEVKSRGHIAKLYGVTTERIGQIERRALKKMEHRRDLVLKKEDGIKMSYIRLNMSIYGLPTGVDELDIVARISNALDKEFVLQFADDIDTEIVEHSASIICRDKSHIVNGFKRLAIIDADTCETCRTRDGGWLTDVGELTRDCTAEGGCRCVAVPIES